MSRFRSIRYCLGFTLCLLFGCGGGSAAPTGGTSTPVTVDLPAVVMPTSVATSVSDVGSANLAVLPSIDPAISAVTLKIAVPEAAVNFDRMQDAVDHALSVFGGMSCAAGTGTTTCQFTNTASQTVKIDFGSFTFDAFSANNTNQTCSLSCVADTNTALSSTALCMRVWVDNTRHLIGKFTVRPISTDKGAGCFRSYDPVGGTVLGVIYDRSDATGEASSGPNSYLEMFVDLSVAPDSHGFASETGATESSQLINFNLYGVPSESMRLLNTARWVRNVDLWYGNLTFGSSSDTKICATKAGVATTGCGTDLTSPDLPDFLDASVSGDVTFPSTSVFPSAPTF